MPKTKFQSVVFTLIMVFCMVFCMTVYSIALKYGELNYMFFLLAIREMWLEYFIVFCLIFFVISQTAQKLAFQLFEPGIDKPILVILAIQCFTVCMIVPCITLFATFIHNGYSRNWFVQWIQLASICFPVALCLQVFFVGPFVRLIFRKIFRING